MREVLKPNTPRDYAVLREDTVLRERLGDIIDVKLESYEEFPSYEVLHEFLSTVIEKEIPEKAKVRQRETWWDANIVVIGALIEEREKARRLYYCKSTPGNKSSWAQWKRIVQSELRKMESAHWQEICYDIISKAETGDSRGYFSAIKTTYGNQPSKPERKSFRKADGNMTVDAEETLKAMECHTSTLLNPPGGVVLEDAEKYLPEQSDVIDTMGEEFTTEELLKALTAMKSRKACGNDGIPVEFWSYVESRKLHEFILKLFNKSLVSGQVEHLFKDVIIQFLHKKGDKAELNNYRTLSLINHIGKVLERMVSVRLSSAAERYGWLPEEQNGFRSARGTVDSLFCLRILSSYCREKGIPCFIAFVDLTKAYDKVARAVLWLLLERLGVPANLVGLIKGLHVGTVARVREAGKFSEEFELLIGLKQGSIFAPVLFNIFFGAIIKAIRKRFEEERVNDVKVQTGIPMTDPISKSTFTVQKNSCRMVSVSDILYADDSAFMAMSEEGLQKMMCIADVVLAAFGQEISIKKTEVMVVQPKGAGRVQMAGVEIRGQTLGSCDSFKYVGSQVNDSASMNKEVTQRIRMMSASYRKHRVNLLENRALSLRLRLEGFQAFVATGALYGCETWNERQEDRDRLESVQFRLLRRVLRYHWSDHKSFATIIHDCRQQGVNILPFGIAISRARLAYFGHICRMESNRLPRMLLLSQVVGKCAIGGQEHNYKKAILSDIEAFNIVRRNPDEHISDWEARRWATVLDIAADRVKWRAVTKTEGVAYRMQNFYDVECYYSNKRHQKSDGASYIPKVPYKFRHTTSIRDLKATPYTYNLVGLTEAIRTGAVAVGRGKQERRKVPMLAPKKLQFNSNMSFARECLQVLLH
jgi:hypothetical protein